MIRASYTKGSYPDLAVDWEVAGVLVTDLADRTISLSAFKFGDSEIAFTKTTGFTAVPLNVDLTAPSPNLVVAWSQVDGEELDSLDVDTEYYLLFDGDGINENLRMVGSLVMRQNAPNVGYCEIMDLQLGDLAVPAEINKYTFINSAANEMDAEIGQRYVLPLNLALAPDWVSLKLKTINQQLASGRIICAQAVGQEDSKLNAYGEHLITMAYKSLEQIASGGVMLTGLALDPHSFQTNSPKAVNRDAASAVDTFEDLFMRRTHTPHLGWRPGTPA